MCQHCFILYQEICNQTFLKGRAITQSRKGVGLRGNTQLVRQEERITHQSSIVMQSVNFCVQLELSHCKMYQRIFKGDEPSVCVGIPRSLSPVPSQSDPPHFMTSPTTENSFELECDAAAAHCQFQKHSSSSTHWGRIISGVIFVGDTFV